MDPASYTAIMSNCRSVAGFLGTVDFDELAECAGELRAPEKDRDLIDILGTAARRLPAGHP